MSLFIVAWGEPGIYFNVGSNFERAAKTAGEELEANGHSVKYFPIRSIDGFQGLLDSAAKYNASAIAIYTHGGWDSVHLGDGKPDDYNRVFLGNVGKLINKAKSLSSIFLYACYTGSNDNGIAFKLAKQLNVTVHGATGGMEFSDNPAKLSGRKTHPNTGPTYMVHSGGHDRVFVP